MGISITGMAFFYYREGKVSENYREIAEAAKASAVPVLEDGRPVMENCVEELCREQAGEGEIHQEEIRENAEENRSLEGEEGRNTEAEKSQEWKIDYDWDALTAVNEETAGWLYLPESMINFPVVGASDNGFYLNHGFDREKSSAGCLFMNQDTGEEDFNRVIYGHNMGTGSEAMFSTLVQFSEEEYFDDHPAFYFTECYGITEIYEVMAVVKYDVKDVGEWDFRAREHETMEDYNRWFEQLEERACFYREPEKAPDKILTLATCDRREYGKDGRLLVIGAAASR